MRSHLRRRSLAQTITEYMLVISVVVMALTAVTKRVMYPVLEEGSQTFREKQAQSSKDGYVGSPGGANTDRR